MVTADIKELACQDGPDAIAEVLATEAKSGTRGRDQGAARPWLWSRCAALWVMTTGPEVTPTQP